MMLISVAQEADLQYHLLTRTHTYTHTYTHTHTQEADLEYSEAFVRIFFVSFVLVVGLFLFNIVVAVLLDEFLSTGVLFNTPPLCPLSLLSVPLY